MFSQIEQQLPFNKSHTYYVAGRKNRPSRKHTHTHTPTHPHTHTHTGSCRHRTRWWGWTSLYASRCGSALIRPSSTSTHKQPDTTCPLTSPEGQLIDRDPRCCLNHTKRYITRNLSYHTWPGKRSRHGALDMLSGALRIETNARNSS